ncbi:MAG: hypothetical protein WC860_03650 [Candidatus Margulisiibacteriota bacterium]|jgi:hypothetical protein
MIKKFKTAHHDKKFKKYEKLLETLLPQIESDEDNIILAEVLLSLKMEGLVGNELSEKEIELVRLLKDLVKELPEKKQEALYLAQKLKRKL